MKPAAAAMTSVEGRLAEQILSENEILFPKIMAALGCGREEVATALREVVRFLSLASQHDNGQLTPSQRVDLAWHEFILCTRAYQEFCEVHFGRMIHHDPGGPNAKHRRQFQETVRCYEQRFGSPDRRYWGGERVDPSDCGPCETI